MTKIKLAKQRLEAIDDMITNLGYRKLTVDEEWMTDDENEDAKQINKMLDELVLQLEKLI